MIDLHTHTTASDGSMTPSELVLHAIENGIEAIAITDHDGIGGVNEAVNYGGLEVVPGIELSVESDTETHILGYYIDVDNPKLLAALGGILEVRMQRNYEYSAKLKKLGFDVSVEEAAALAPNGLIARAHFAKVMAMKGYSKSVKDAFDDYLSNGKPAYSSLQYLTAEQGVELIKAAGGVAYVAHLHLIHMEDEPLKRFIKKLMDYGLDGIEGYYTEYTPEHEFKYQKMAADLGIKISGGTDFHGAMKPHIAIGRGYGNMNVPYDILKNIKEHYGKA